MTQLFEVSSSSGKTTCRNNTYIITPTTEAPVWNRVFRLQYTFLPEFYLSMRFSGDQIDYAYLFMFEEVNYEATGNILIELLIPNVTADWLWSNWRQDAARLPNMVFCL